MNKDPKQVMNELNSKFISNFSEWGSLKHPKLDRAFVGLRSIAVTGELLSSSSNSAHHIICSEIYDEIFSDGVSAVYLASIAMDKPARIVLRRVLELGLAAIFLWDMPHMAFSWKKVDQDLSFSEMLRHVNSPGYLEYVNKENKYEITVEIILSSKAQNIYGMLSDIVHGKITTFESSMPNRYKFVENEWDEFIDLLNEVIDLLIEAFIRRFNIKDALFDKLPQAKKEFS